MLMSDDEETSSGHYNLIIEFLKIKKSMSALKSRIENKKKKDLFSLSFH